MHQLCKRSKVRYTLGMSIGVSLFAIAVLFYITGKAADRVVLGLRSISHKLHIPLAVVGVILGLLTSLPEFAIGINSIASGHPELAIGNLLGGVFVLFGVILPLSIFLNKGSRTDGRLSHIAPVLLFNLLPVLLFTIRGVLGVAEGVLLLGGYIIAVYAISREKSAIHKYKNGLRHNIGRDLFMVLAGGVVILVASHFIVTITEVVLLAFPIPEFLVGLLVFSIGTNLPELIISVEAWRRGAKGLSIANLLGSAMGQAFILGLFALIAPLPIDRDIHLYFILVMKLLLFAMIASFYRSDRRLNVHEGVLLALFYLVFAGVQVAMTLFLS
ncbi:MAG: hypothetical protein COV07_04545 [Candidatus Vogelbacteria bacterium CG10_big_fil_rev_8_21_14_0_10_45_14]|uniref:Sodium/calcium exchanger membrane region domain-containing protein n=1 Tax=Candidatus Vogelbacteria bacterium CG10_big_fil_rev_8_21_14_0_10_45_14 TaxID=1975042 RepID=A0A2H0RIC4_9BACT|nr:MAG: hypothetical protein COV07_04545 [Candidatus Vogelbacteria bacterium CG10_big_fil_rev_8_21_14_0_10_45_14]